MKIKSLKKCGKVRKQISINFFKNFKRRTQYDEINFAKTISRT